MKRILLIVLVILTFSCGPDNESTNSKEETSSTTNPYGVADSLLIEGEYLVFLDEGAYPPLMFSWRVEFDKDTAAIRTLENRRISEIREFADSLYGLEIAENDVYIYAFSAFLVKGLNADGLSKILGDTTGKIKEVEPNFYMQNTRARMQSGTPILQNTRARMQEHPEWGYNEATFTSKAVEYLGGGVPNPSSINKIWIVDSGIDTTHQDLKGMIEKRWSESFVEDGINPPRDENAFSDCWGHGTACAGLAAAKPANAGNPDPNLIGMKGVSPGAKLVSLKVFGQDGRTKYGWLLAAINHAATRSRLTAGDILSFSLGGEVIACNRPHFVQRVKDVAREKSVFFVFAAGNGRNGPGEDATNILPACIDSDGIFTIGSMDLDFEVDPFTESYSSFSNYKMPPIDWIAPGNFIFTTYPGNQYAVMQGTSMSAALFAGLLHLTNGTLNTRTTVPGIHGEPEPYPVPRR